MELIEASTDTAHMITLDALSASRKGKGRYIAVCGADLVPHSLTAPPLRRCASCAIPTQRRSR